MKKRKGKLSCVPHWAVAVCRVEGRVSYTRERQRLGHKVRFKAGSQRELSQPAEGERTLVGLAWQFVFTGRASSTR